MAEKRFDILSPDGIPIHPSKTYTQTEIGQAFEEWKHRFSIQGYYSSVTYGRIPLGDLKDYCEVVEVEPVEED